MRRVAALFLIALPERDLVGVSSPSTVAIPCRSSERMKSSSVCSYFYTEARESFLVPLRF